jgi:hypothetical protein
VDQVIVNDFFFSTMAFVYIHKVDSCLRLDMVLSYCLLIQFVLLFAGNAKHVALSLGHEDIGDDFE